MHIFTLGDLGPFVASLKELGNYTFVSLDQFLPAKKTHEEYETAVLEHGFFDKMVQESPADVVLVVNPAESSGAVLVFVHELIESGKTVHVQVIGRWKKNTIQNRFIFRLVFGVLSQKAAITEKLYLSLFPQDVYSLSYKGPLIEENSEMMRIFANIFHAKNVFTNSTEKAQLSGDYAGNYETFQHFSARSKVSCLAKTNTDQLNTFQGELKKMMDACELTCEVIRRDMYCSGEETTNDKIERFLNDSPHLINNLKFYSLGKNATLFEIFFM